MYGLIGKNLSHSFSAQFFNEKFLKEGIVESYHLFPLNRIEELKSLIFQTPQLKGLNVTIPYKEKIIPYLDYISKEASEIGAVNVIKILRQESGIKLLGYNTDSIGFRDSIKPVIPDNVKKALILGTGGASRAIDYILRQEGIKTTFISREPNKKNKEKKNSCLGYADLTEKDIIENLLIVNTTPLGMYPATDTYPPIPYHFLTENHLCYDLVYNPDTTEFMKRCANYGAKVKNGLEMLTLQALGAWEIWRNR